MSDLRDTYQKITDQVLKLMDGGTAPWRMPWTSEPPRSFRTERPYRGINRLVLSATAATLGYSSPYWITWAQGKPLGISPRKGERATPIVYWVVKDEGDRAAPVDGAKRSNGGKTANDTTKGKGPNAANSGAAARAHQAGSSNSLDENEADDATPAKGSRGRSGRHVFPRAYAVWNLDQTNLRELLASGKRQLGKRGIPADAFGPPAGAGQTFVGIEAAEYIVENMPNPPTIRVGQQNMRAYYSPVDDRISIPGKAAFERPSAYYATLFHELGHSTGHPSRCGRPGIMIFDHFGSDRYGREELVAEFTSCFLAAEAGIAPLEIENSAAYLRSWRKTIQADPRLVLTAAGQAQRAADYVLGRVATGASGRSGNDSPAQAA